LTYPATLAETGGAPNALANSGEESAVFDHTLITYTHVDGVEYKIGDHIAYRTAGEVLIGQILDIMASARHQFSFFVRNYQGYVMEAYPHNLIYLRKLEDISKWGRLDHGFCRIHEDFYNTLEVPTLVMVDDFGNRTGICTDCVKDPCFQCSHCAFVYDSTRTASKQDLPDGTVACSDCYQRYYAKCTGCQEVRRTNTMLAVNSANHVIGQPKRFCLECQMSSVILRCYSCSIPYDGYGDRLLSKDRNSLTNLNRPVEIVLEGDEEEAETTEPAVMVDVCYQCLDSMRAGRQLGQRQENVIRNYTYRPERMMFLGDRTNVKEPLPGKDRKKQPFLRRDWVPDANIYASKREGDWKGDVKVAPGWSTFADNRSSRALASKRPIYPAQLYIGMELEVEMKGEYAQMANAVASKLQSKMDGSVYIKRDGSLTNGFEIVTHPGTYDWWMNDFNYKSVSGAGKYCVSYSARTCGNHFHMSKNAFSVLHLYKFAKFHYRNTEFITFIAERYSKRYAAFNENENNNLARISKNKSSENGRYLAVNMTPEHTVELRYFRGNLKQERIKKNLQFLHALYVFSKLNGIRDMTFIKFLDFVIESRKTYPDLFDFIQNFTPEGR
jgi:hypothetical protein